METIVNKKDFIKSLSEEEFDNGCFKFDIYDGSPISEGVWGWLPPDDIQKYYNGELNCSVKCILVNQPLSYGNKLRCYDEVAVKFNKQATPCLDPDWVKENL